MIAQKDKDQKVKGLKWEDKVAEDSSQIFYCDAGFITDIPHASLEDAHSIEADSYEAALDTYAQRIKDSGWHYFMPVQISARSFKYSNYGRRTRTVGHVEYVPFTPAKPKESSEMKEFIEPIESVLTEGPD